MDVLFTASAVLGDEVYIIIISNDIYIYLIFKSKIKSFDGITGCLYVHDNSCFRRKLLAEFPHYPLILNFFNVLCWELFLKINHPIHSDIKLNRYNSFIFKQEEESCSSIKKRFKYQNKTLQKHLSCLNRVTSDGQNTRTRH